MAAVSEPENSGVPRRKRRRVWLIWLAAAWVVVVSGLGAWSVRRDAATVPEQRDIVTAVGDLQRTVGVLFAAADGDGRAVVLGGLDMVPDCRVTPVRRGMIASREVTVYVAEGEARTAFDAIAAGLPSDYRAEVSELRGGTRLSLFADAGNFVAIDGDAEAGAGALTVRVTTGCRPRGGTEPDRADPVPGGAPVALSALVNALGGTPSEPSMVTAVNCPEGGVAATYAVDEVAAPAGFEGRMREASAGGTLLRADESVWAYRLDGDSVVVVPDEKNVRISVSSGC
ncbi:hypothetical protein Ari01nite_53820 [Paractinoplanes rishiriensis]|uniref:Uncharacterized protein n=1 Tax=Paractinoplanes rishiriensis TaxID=1050105 RepID=A0A919K302_9ACTN|nr:hypothetical protein Ari01nite_53820 [Actinoplanes rishiriensis]